MWASPDTTKQIFETRHGKFVAVNNFSFIIHWPYTGSPLSHTPSSEVFNEWKNRALEDIYEQRKGVSVRHQYKKFSRWQKVMKTWGFVFGAAQTFYRNPFWESPIYLSVKGTGETTIVQFTNSRQKRLKWQSVKFGRLI